MRDLKKVRRVVLDTLSEQFDHVRIVDAKVHDDVGSGGDPLLRIDVIFDGSLKDLNARQLSGAIRKLRPKLGDIDEFAFPLLTFISKADVRRGKQRASA